MNSGALQTVAGVEVLAIEVWERPRAGRRHRQGE